MRYIALRDFALHLERVKDRADAGGHSASEKTLRAIYHSSLGNLPRALAEMDRLWIFDNSAPGDPPELLLEAEQGTIRRFSSALARIGPGIVNQTSVAAAPHQPHPVGGPPEPHAVSSAER